MRTRKPDPETDNAPLYGTKKSDLEKTDDSLQFPGENPPQHGGEDMEIIDPKPDREKKEEDSPVV